MDISYITSCKSDHNVEKRSTDKLRLYFMWIQRHELWKKYIKIIILNNNVYTDSDFLNG